MLSNITVVSLCSSHLLRGIKYFIQNSQWYHRNKALKKIVLKSLGCYVVCTDFSIVKTIVKLVDYVFFSQFNTDKYIEQLRILEKAINQYNGESLDAENIVSDDNTGTPDMQQQSDDVMKANSKSTEEKNMVITCRILSFWDEFLQQEHIDNKGKEKQTKNQYYCPDFVDRFKRFYLPTQNHIKQKVCKLSNKNNLCRNQYQCTNRGMFQKKKYSSRLNENMNIS